MSASKLSQIGKSDPSSLLECVTKWLTVNINVFCQGIFDTFSLHRTVRILVNDPTSARLTLQILATNLVLLLGSVYFFNKGVSPLLNFMKTNLVEAEHGTNESYAELLGWVMYQAMWLVPVCALCYGCSMAWYQDLADSSYKYLQGVPKSSPLTKSVGNALYGTLVWLSAFIQVKLLAVLGPMLCSHMSDVVELFFLGLTSNSIETPHSVLFISIAKGLKHAIQLWIYTASSASRLVGLALLCVMYGWYGFEPKWIASGLDPDARFAILERHWAYFMGFGLPYVLLMENTSFFVGYGIFLGMFPFCILLGSVCSYADAYRPYSGSKNDDNSLPVFKTAQSWTLFIIRYIDKQAYQQVRTQKLESRNASIGRKESKNTKKNK